MRTKLSLVIADLGYQLILTMAVIIFLLPLAIFGLHDQEEWGGSIWSTLQYSLALWDGRMPPMWSDFLGLGTPMPIGHRLDFSPPFFLYPLISIRWVFVIYYTFYLSIAIVYFWKICKQYEFPVSLNLILSISFLFSAPTIQLVYLDDWPTLFHNWCFFPVVFYYLRQLFLTTDFITRTNGLLALSLVGGLWALNGHSGHLFSLVSILVVYIFYMTSYKKKGFLNLLFACCIAAAIASEHLYFLVTETLSFPSDIARTMAQDGLSFREFFITLIRPLDVITASLFSSKNIFDSVELWNEYLKYPNLRTPFVGTLILFAAIFASIRCFLSGDLKNSFSGERRAISLAFLLSFVAMFAKASWFNNIPSGTWMYRDGVVFFGLISVGMWLKVHWFSKVGFLKWMPTLVFLHFLQIFSSAYPAFHQTIVNPGLYNFENFGKSNLLPGWISSLSDKNYSRLFITTNNGPRSRYAKEGLYGATDLTFLGVIPFTAWIKSVSMDLIGKSISLGHGWIPGNLEILKNHEMLNVFGVSLILVTSQEMESEIFSDLKEQFAYLGKYETSSGSVYLLKNLSKWPEAFMMSMGVLDLNPNQRACIYSGAICDDFTNWQNYLLLDKVKISGDNGIYNINLESSPITRLFVTSKLYRSEWKVSSSNKALEVIKVGGSLVGVVVPPNVDKFSLRFEPTMRIKLRYLSMATFVVLLIFIVYFRILKK